MCHKTLQTLSAANRSDIVGKRYFLYNINPVNISNLTNNSNKRPLNPIYNICGT